VSLPEASDLNFLSHHLHRFSSFRITPALIAEPCCGLRIALLRHA
jgi:hypothetical protein